MLFAAGRLVHATCVAPCLLLLPIVVDGAVASRRSTRVLLLRVPRLATVDILGPMDWQVKAGILDEHGWWDRLAAMGWRRRRYGDVIRPAPRNWGQSLFRFIGQREAVWAPAARAAATPLHQRDDRRMIMAGVSSEGEGGT